MVLEVNEISKSFGQFHALQNVSLSVEEHECVSIIGPSGSGKTTLLKLIALMENPTSGTIRFDRPVSNDNPVILVFQDYVLFPHMTAYENVAFGLRVRKMPKHEIRRRVEESLHYFGIADKADTYPSHLSGGQKQRVAIARALVLNPYVLLLDEPFANLDKNLKMETAELIRRTQKAFGITTISVTHDLEEAFVMSDRIGILLDGKLVQYDDVRTTYFEPSNIRAAQFLGPVNKITPDIQSRLQVCCEKPESGRTVYARAEGLELAKDQNGVGRIREVRFVGLMILYTVEIGSETLTVYSLNDGLSEGDSVSVRLIRYFTQNEE